MSNVIPSLSPAVEKRLQEAGWSPLRRIDAREHIEYLHEQGFRAGALARDVLANLGGLEFDLPQGGVSWIAFDTVGAVRFTTPQELQRLESIVGDGLTPIGHGGGFILLVGESGRSFLLQDEWFVLLSAPALGGLLHFAFTGEPSNCERIPLIEE